MKVEKTTTWKNIEKCKDIYRYIDLYKSLKNGKFSYKCIFWYYSNNNHDTLHVSHEPFFFKICMTQYHSHRHLFLSMGGHSSLLLLLNSKREEGPLIDRNKCLCPVSVLGTDFFYIYAHRILGPYHVFALIK